LLCSGLLIVLIVLIASVVHSLIWPNTTDMRRKDRTGKDHVGKGRTGKDHTGKGHTGKDHNRTLKKSRIPPIPGPKVCSPLAHTRKNGRDCLPDSAIETLLRNRPVKKGGSKGSLTKNNSENVTKELAKELGCKANDSRCMVERSLVSHKEKKHLLNSFFRPKMPDTWKKDPKLWLNSDDIAVVMKQYEAAYPEFLFLGVVPIDFAAPDPYTGGNKKCMNNQFCLVNLAEEKAKGRRILGAVFNLDPHYKEGSHWVALAIDLQRGCSYYFDSYGMEPPQQVKRYMRYLTTQDPTLKLQRNGRRFQFKESECGMYSMYFLIRMIAGESFKKFCKTPIADKYMIEFRRTLYDENA
jgi:hypothetical protein